MNAIEQLQVEQQKALFNVVAKIRESLDLDTIFKATTTEVRHLLSADRVGIFQFYPGTHWNDGEFVSEDVAPKFSSVLAARIHDHCFGDQYAVQYQQGCIQAVSDIQNAGLKDCHVDVLARFQIRANLVVPLLRNEDLWGLLCIHQCSTPRHWQEWEIEFVQQIAVQLGVALQQAELLRQTQAQSLALAKALADLQKTQTQLIQTEKMSSLGQLVAGVAHEINNPVNFIYGNLVYVDGYTQDLIQMMKLYQQYYPETVPEIEEQAQAVELDFLLEDLPKILNSMRIGAERIREIVLSLRNFARSDEAEIKQVNIHDGIDSTLLILQHRLKKTPSRPAIQVVRNYASLPHVECYPGQLNQVFMNILANAIDALDGYGHTLSPFAQPDVFPPKWTGLIQIQTEMRDAATICIRISDNGPGIGQDALKQLFNPFFTTKPAGQGTGLGLAISYQVVTERHGGRLTCQSEPGRGTEFVIEIPIHSKRSAGQV